SDGTEDGTFMHADIAEGSGSSVVLNILTTNDQLFFYAYGAEGRNLYHMNNAQEAPSVVKDIWPGEDDDVQFVVKVGDEVYFRADDTDGFGQGNDLWKSDGTEEGTVKVKDWGSSGANPEGFFGTDDRVYFQMEEYGTTSQWGIYSSDGTEEATLQLAQHNFSANGSASFQFIEINDGIIYLPGGSLDREPYFANDEGAGLIRTIYPGTPSPYIINMIDYEGVVYFVADDGSTGDELWRTDGTFDGTYRVIDLANGASRGALNFRDFVSNSSSTVGRVDNGMVFGGQTGNGDYELFFSDGTEEGTFLLLDINPNGSSNPYNFYYGENYTYFTAQDGTHGYELWRTDGTSEGTSLVADVAEGASSSSPEDFIEKDGYLYFTASTPHFFKDLFRIDQRCIVPEINLSATTVCTDQEINFDASVISMEGTLESNNWSFGDNTSSELINASHSYSQAGDYDAELILVNDNGCSYSESISISVLAQPTASIEEELTPLCLSSEWNPENTSTPDLFYTWDFGSAGTSEVENPAVQFTEIGTYLISLEVSNGSCSNSSNTTVDVYSPTIELIATQSPDCPGDSTGSIEVIASSNEGSMIYSMNEGTFAPTPLFTELESGSYTINAQDAQSCIVSLIVEVEGPEEIDLSATINQDDGTGIDSIQVTAEGGTPPYEFNLDGDLPNDTGLFEN
ncbi:MAG: ELWxxDGT repeat protein, partial [Flavobacteriales bacterium]